MLGTKVTPAQLLQGRSPSLDLDSLYGAGPSDPQSAQFYDADGVHLKMGKTVAAGGIGVKDGFDLPRGAGSGAAQKRRAVIPDKRNDENLAVAQTHLAMIRFHNRVVDTLPASVPAAQRFSTARDLVTKHYQWMVRTDYLPRIAAKAVVDDVFKNGRKAFEPSAAPTSVPTMPIEFSVAAFRLGHSMVRRAYNWNRIFDDGGGTLDFLFLFSSTSGDLGGGARLPSNWIADFRRLYDFNEEQEVERPAAVVEDPVPVVGAADHRVPERERGDGKLDRHRGDRGGRRADLEGLAPVVEDIVDHRLGGDPRQVVRADHPLVVLGHQLARGAEPLGRGHRGRQRVDHAVVEADHRQMRLRDREVLVVALVGDDGLALLRRAAARATRQVEPVLGP